jgi:hypothetical protein
MDPSHKQHGESVHHYIVSPLVLTCVDAMAIESGVEKNEKVGAGTSENQDQLGDPLRLT